MHASIRLPILATCIASAFALAPLAAVAQTNIPAAIDRAATTQPLSAKSAQDIERVRNAAADLESKPLRPSDNAGTSGAAGAENSGQTSPNAGLIRPVTFDFTRIASALAIVVALIVGARLLLRRFFAGASAPATSRAVKIIGRTAIAPRQQVLLIQVGTRIIVTAESGGTLSTLAQIEDADEVARLLGQLQDEQTQRAASFGGLFGRVQKTYEEDGANAATSPAEPTGDGQAPRTQAAALEDEHQLSQAKSELSGLVEKVRSLRSQMGQ